MSNNPGNSAAQNVAKIIAMVRNRGDRALVELLRKYDGINLHPRNFQIKRDIVKSALNQLDGQTRSALKSCARQIRSFHQWELKFTAKPWVKSYGGVRIGQIIRPVRSVGVYVPGGRFSYPSTVLMSAIPAKVAGVKTVVVVTPPQKLTTELLAAADVAGVDAVFQVGGPGAVAALAMGTGRIPKVDLIVGPGNAYVTEAKRQLFGEVGIDLLAGPSELVVLADKSARPEFVAADLRAQAEHDPWASGVLISMDKTLVTRVKVLIPREQRKQVRLIYQPNVTKAVELLNRCAGEHVEIMVRNPATVLDRVENAGAIFVGPLSPAVMGDYWAGPSHVLPTGRSARFSSGLSIRSFLKTSSRIEIGSRGFKRGGPAAFQMAMSEGLLHHADSVKIRMREAI